MKITFRTDASMHMGTGHVMRCLTLAEALTVRGAQCAFICREHAGNLIQAIQSKGYEVHVLPAPPFESHGQGDELAHSNWLGATQDDDALACQAILQAKRPDWLVVDHYAIDARWEDALAPYYNKLMVIDDLADRLHRCDLLLDQTFGRDAADYATLVPTHCRLLCGSQFALLRPEFAALRTYSLQRRAAPQLRHLLITMGGVDKDNATGQVLDALKTCALPLDCQITVVMGHTAPWLSAIQKQAKSLPWPTQVLADVNNMAQLMADSDLAIGAAGATSWERCCLGLPTLMIVLAENQRFAAAVLEIKGAVRLLDLDANFQANLKQEINTVVNFEASMSHLRDSSSVVCDGNGCAYVASWLMTKEEK